MAETSYPFDNQDSTESQWSTITRRYADTGVLGTPGTTDLLPYADSTGLYVKVPAGQAVVRGFTYVNDSVLTLTVAAASSSTRVDSVVLRLDPTTANAVNAVVKPGTPGSTSGPGLTQTDQGIFELRLGNVTVPGNATTISGANVADARSFTSEPWGEWTTASRPTASREGRAGYNYDLDRPEYLSPTGWQPFSTGATTNAASLTSGTLANARLDYGVVKAWRNDGGTVDAPVSADLINGDWNAVYQPGSYRVFAGNTNTNAPAGCYLYGTLVLFGAGATMSSRTQVYFEHGANGYVYTRTAWNGTDWNAWQRSADAGDLAALQTTLTTVASGALTAASGFSLNRGTLNKVGRFGDLDLSVTRTGAQINGTASGNISNVAVATVPAGWTPKNQYAALPSGPGGVNGAFYLSGTTVYLAALPPNINCSTGDELTCGGSFITAS